MINGLFLGCANSGETFSYGEVNHDDGTTVLPVLTSNRIAPGGMHDEVIVTAISVNVSANATAAFKLIPIVDDTRYDGVMAPDCSVAFSVAGDGRTTMPLSQDVNLGIGQSMPGGSGAGFARLGLRGQWFQFEIQGTAGVSNDTTGALGVVFLNGLELEFQLVKGTKPPTAPGNNTTPWPTSAGYPATSTGW